MSVKWDASTISSVSTSGSMSTAGSVDPDWWKVTSDLDPLDVAVLYQDLARTSCGHSIRWDRRLLAKLKKCPICQKPVAVIADGPQRQAGQLVLPHETVTVKHGKQVYSVTLIPRQPKGFNFMSWKTPRVTAPQRIQDALGLVNLKILHKGKVIYPSQADSDISQQLVEISKGDFATESSTSQASSNPSIDVAPVFHPSYKISLVAVGTPVGEELQEPQKDSHMWSWIQWSFLLPFQIWYWTLHTGWLLFASFAKPFLPESLIPASLSDDPRPHAD